MTRDTLVQNFGFTHGILNANVEGVTHSESLQPAAPGASSLNWIVGHLLRSRNGVHALVGLEPALDPARLDRYKQGNEATTTDGPDVIPFEDLVSAFNTSHEALMSHLSELGDAELAAPCAHVLDSSQESQVGVQLETFNFHEAYHVGQTGLMRRILGKTSLLPNPDD